MHNLEDEAVLLRHATLHVDTDLPGAIHVLMSLPNSEQKVLELKFLSMLGLYTRDLSNLALLRKRADYKDRKANEDRVKDALGLCELMQRASGDGFHPALPQLMEDEQNAALLEKLADPGFFKKAANAARILQGWMAMFKKANRVGEPNLCSAELFAEIRKNL